jgi:chromosome segregation ATPase
MSNVGGKIKTAGNNIVKSNNNIQPRRQPSSQKSNTKSSKNINMQRKKPSTPSINQRERNILLVQGPNAMPGNGLWCQIPKKEDKPYESIIPKLKAESELLLDPEKAADKKLITELKNQIKELSLKLQDINLKYSDADFRAQRAENLQKLAMKELENKKDEYNDIHENALSMENNVESLNEALNNAKKEITRLQTELNNEIDNNKKLNLRIEELLKEKDKNNYINSEEIVRLQKNISQLNIEKENLIKIIQSKTNKETESNIDIISQQVKDKEKILKSMEITMNKALNENAELKRKLNAEENNKIQLNNIIAKKNAINEDLKSQLEAMKAYIDSNKKEVKWNQSKVNQKDSNIKLMKEKLKQKDEEIKNLNNKITSLNKKLNKKKDEGNKINNGDDKNKEKDDNLMKNEQKIINKEDGSKEIIIPVKAKPFLFGPDPSDYDYVDQDLEKDIFG